MTDITKMRTWAEIDLGALEHNYGPIGPRRPRTVGSGGR